MADGGRLYNMQFSLGNDADGNDRGFGPDGPLTYDAFMAATPQERQDYFNYYQQIAGQAPAHQRDTILGSSLRNILSNDRSASLLSPEQYNAITAGLDPVTRQALFQNLQGIVTAQQQAAADKDFGDYMGPAIGLAGLGLAGGLGLYGAGLIGGGAGAAATASGGATGVGAGGGSLGSGLSLGAGGVTGLTPGVTAGGIGGGALGTGIGVGGGGAAGLAGAGATGLGALGAGYFAGETAYPVFGGLSGSASTGGTALSGAGSAAAATGGTSALSRVLSGNGTMDDYLRLGGAALPGLVGAYASGQQADALRDISAQARADRAPYLQASQNYLANPQAYADGPGRAFLDANLRRLSVQGNPIDNPTSLGLATQAGLQDWRNAVVGFGNLGLAGEDTRAQVDMTAVGADANRYNALGGAAADVFTPRTSLEDLLGKYKSQFKVSLA